MNNVTTCPDVNSADDTSILCRNFSMIFCLSSSLIFTADSLFSIYNGVKNLSHHTVAIVINLITQGLARDYRAVKIKPKVHWGKIRKSIVIKLLKVETSDDFKIPQNASYYKQVSTSVIHFKNPGEYLPRKNEGFLSMHEPREFSEKEIFWSSVMGQSC